jgi:protein-tyrosine phosphatase
VIDLHSHILPGIDDGPGTVELALELARDAVEDGIRVMAATPHVRYDYATTPAQMEQLLESMRVRLSSAGIDLELLPGAEIALEMLPRLTDADLRRLGLAGNPGLLLLETPNIGWPAGLDDRLFELQARGFDIVLAHPERNSEVQERPQRLRELVTAGVLVQLTAASLDGRLGEGARRTASQLLELGLAHIVASDAHTPAVRRVGFTTAAEAIGDPALVRWLMEDAPAALIKGTELPPRPTPVARRRLRLLSRR